VTLGRQGGTWKIDAFAPVGADQSGQGAQSGAQPPAPTPPAGGAQ
jgi:hypothetical protein